MKRKRKGLDSAGSVRRTRKRRQVNVDLPTNRKVQDLRVERGVISGTGQSSGLARESFEVRLGEVQLSQSNPHQAGSTRENLGADTFERVPSVAMQTEQDDSAKGPTDISRTETLSQDHDSDVNHGSDECAAVENGDGYRVDDPQHPDENAEMDMSFSDENAEMGMDGNDENAEMDMDGNDENAETDMDDNDENAEVDMDGNDESPAHPEEIEDKAPGLDHWQKLLPVLLVNGSVKLTRNQYDCLLVLCSFFNVTRNPGWKEKSSDEHKTTVPNDLSSVFPSFRTLRRISGLNLLGKLVVQSEDQLHDLDIGKAGVNLRSFINSSSGSQGTAGKISVRVIPVSEYARADVSCPAVFEEMKRTASGVFQRVSENIPDNQRGIDSPERAGCKSWDCIDDWPLIADRHGFYGRSRGVGVEDPSQESIMTNMAEVGDHLLIAVTDCGPVYEEMYSHFHYQCAEEHYGRGSLIGVIAASWSAIKHESAFESRRVARDLSPMEKQIMEVFHVNDNGRSFCKEICGAGDTFTLLRSPLNHGASSWLLVVHRFIRDPSYQDSSCFFIWIRKRSSASDLNQTHGAIGEYDTEVLNEELSWVPNSIASQGIHRANAGNGHASGSHFQVNRVREIRLVRLVEGRRGAVSSPLIPSIGLMENGKRYFIYRFMLFWDGFRITEGKAASGTGVYMVCLNLPSRSRGGTAAVRVLSLIPPGANVQEIFSRLKEDILKGMTDGFEDYDGDGNPITIFLDFVCSCGDTPALNEVVDVLGHQADACCHLCKFSRGLKEKIKIVKEGLLRSSRYMSTEVHSSREFARRDITRHKAINLSEAEDETRRILGFKANGIEGIYGLHDISENFDSIRDKIPLNSAGNPLLPSVLDPYQSLLVGPDHLLAGHAKDCVNAALQLISPDCRVSYEIFAISAMKDCRLPTQNRIVNRKTGHLFAMKLSDLYTVLFVSEFAFCKALNLNLAGREELTGNIAERENRRGTSSNPSRINKVVRIIGDLSKLIARFCYSPISYIDGKAPYKDYNRQLGQARVWNIQGLVKKHLRALEDLCTIDVDLPRQIREVSRAALPRVEREKEKRRLMRDAREANIVRAEVDHPNVHRLLEMTQTVLPMVGDVTRVSELVFEKAHQALKRAIKQSNNRNPHLDAMSSAAFNDWQGRLTVCYKDLNSTDLEKKRKAEIAVFRLLRGREQVHLRKARLGPQDLEFIRKAMGPPGTVDKILKMEDRKVLVTGKRMGDAAVSWEVRDRKYPVNNIPCCYSVQSDRSNVGGHRPERSSGLESFGSQRFGGWTIRELFDVYVQNGITVLDKVYGKRSYRLGNLAHMVSSDGSRFDKSYELESGQVLQSLTFEPSTQQGRFVRLASCHDTTEETEKVTYWFALRFYQTKIGCGVLALPCRALEAATSSSNSTLRMTEGDDFEFEPKIQSYCISHPPDRIPYFLKLDRSCRRVAVLHNCTNECNAGSQELFIQHAGHILNSSFYIIDRRSGYPPHRV